MSTVPIRQAFNSKNNILNERQYTFSPDYMETQVLLEDWTKVIKRIQGMQLLKNEINDFDTEWTTTMGSENRSE